MKTYFDCIPCLVRHALNSVRLVTDDERVHEQVLRGVLAEASEMDFSEPPPAMARRTDRRIRELTGVADPYASRKRELNHMAISLCEELRPRVCESDDPMESAVRVAIAGNMMDLGVKNDLDVSDVRRAIFACFSESLDADVDGFRRDVDQARRILYLADNAGEIVFDRLLIEQLPTERTTVAVKGGPAINDAMLEDAEAAGLVGLVDVIDNGSDAPGTILADCSETFRQRFDEADLIISKGQGNYETLSGSQRPIYYLLRVKCPVLARDLNRPLGSMVLRRANGEAG